MNMSPEFGRLKEPDEPGKKRGKYLNNFRFEKKRRIYKDTKIHILHTHKKSKKTK